jgi:hypothetical protein
MGFLNLYFNMGRLFHYEMFMLMLGELLVMYATQRGI